MGRYTQIISQRLIPLPKELSCNDIKKVAFNDIKIDVIYPEDALLRSAKRKLVSFFGNSLYGSFKIRIVDPMPETLNVLNHFPNSDQAYRIWSDGSINISALTSKGIMNGVRTLLQAVSKEDGMFNIPLLFIYDYPDIPLRGQRSETAVRDIAYMASLKLNSADYMSINSIDEEKRLKENCINEGIVLNSNISYSGCITDENLCVLSENADTVIFDWMTYGGKCIFPRTAVDFIKENCEKFVENKTRKVVCYTPVSDIYQKFNITAMAEWLWNAKGRDTESFMRAYATVNRMDPDKFVKWCTYNMTPARTLAENGFIARLMSNRIVTVKGKEDLDYCGFDDFIENAIIDIDKYIRMADRAVRAAKQTGYEEGETESRCVTAVLRCAGAQQKFFTLYRMKKRNPEEEQQMVLMYEMMHNNSRSLYYALLDWKNVVDKENLHFHTGITCTAVACMRMADLMKKILEKLDIKHREHHSLSYHEIGGWDVSVFDKEGIAELTYDIAKYADKEGRYHICFDYTDGKSDISVKSISGLCNNIEKAHVLYDNTSSLKRLNNDEPWYEVFIDVECTGRDQEKILKIILERATDNKNKCNGIVGIRKI